MRKQEEFGLILCKTVQNQPRSWFCPKMNHRTVDTRSRNSVSSYAKLAVKLHFNCPKTACWLDTLPLACWWPLFRQRNSMFMKEFCCSQDVVAAMKSFWAHIHGLLTPMALTFLIKYYSPLGLVGFQQLWVVYVNYLSLGGPIKAILQRTDHDVINTCFCISLIISPMIGQFSWPYFTERPAEFQILCKLKFYLFIWTFSFPFGFKARALRTWAINSSRQKKIGP